MKKTEYETVVVGAGPAGLRCAIRLFEGGARDLLVVEKAVFPRDKLCAGYITGVTRKEYENAGLDFGKCRYSLIDDFNIIFKFDPKQKIRNFFLFTSDGINRVDLDHAFFLAAKEKGIEIAEDTHVTGFSADGRLTVSEGGTEREIGFGNVVFADGAAGFSSRFFKDRRRNIAMQLIFDADGPDKIDIHFGVTKRGYGWESAKGGRVNVGLTDVYDPETDYRELFAGFMKKLGRSADISGLRAAFTPIGVKIPAELRRKKNVFFVGDALGACDPITLSGLRYGLKSGLAAADAVLAGKRAPYTRCVRSLRVRFALMRLLQKAFYLRPALFLTFNVGCRYFGGMIAFVFNRFFVNKK